jgi:hypothetical protein
MEVLKWTIRSFPPVLATHIFKSGFAQRSMDIWSSIYKQWMTKDTSIDSVSWHCPFSYVTVKVCRDW